MELILFTALDMDEMAVLDIISHARKDILPLKPLTGSTARQSAIEEYSLDGKIIIFLSSACNFII